MLQLCQNFHNTVTKHSQTKNLQKTDCLSISPAHFSIHMKSSPSHPTHQWDLYSSSSNSQTSGTSETAISNAMNAQLCDTCLQLGSAGVMIFHKGLTKQTLIFSLGKSPMCSIYCMFWLIICFCVLI